jgi:hypothetical protein
MHEEVLPLNGLLSGLLLHRPSVGVDLQMVLNYLPRDSGICDGCHANMSTLARTKVMSVSDYLSPRFPTIQVVWVTSTPIWMTFTGTSSLSEG